MTEKKANEVKIHHPKKTDAAIEESIKTQDAKEETVATTEKKEVGGRNGPEPTRFGDWEKNGRCVDF